MAVYLSLPILNEAVRFVEDDSINESSVKAMAVGILNYYFPAANNCTVAPKQHRYNSQADFVILRIQPQFPGNRAVYDHAIAEARSSMDSFKSILEHLEDTLEHANIPFERCWAIVIHGAIFNFYEYHRNLPENERLIPCGPPTESQRERRDSFHARNDSVEIDWMLRHVAQNDTPPAR